MTTTATGAGPTGMPAPPATESEPGALPAVVVDTTGRTWRVRRAWPGGRHGVPVELEPAGARLAAASGASDHTPDTGVRAGWWRGAGTDMLPAGADPKLPALATVNGTVVSHRPGKRAVVRTADGLHVKVVRDGRAAGVLDGIARAASFADSFRMPEVVAADESTVRFTTLTGRSLHDNGGHDATMTATEWHRAWHQVMAAHLAAGAVPGGGVAAIRAPASGESVCLVVHDAVAEIAVLRRWTEHWIGPGAATTIAPPVEGRDWTAGLGRVADRVAADLLTGTPGPLRVIHRDLHDKQLLWDPVDGPGLLDVDTACWGEAALDLGNLRAHARWRHLQGVWTADRAATVVDTIDRAANDAGITERVAPYERAALLRIACVHAFRPADRPHLGRLVTEVVRDLG